MSSSYLPRAQALLATAYKDPSVVYQSPLGTLFKRDGQGGGLVGKNLEVNGLTSYNTLGQLSY